MCMIYAYYTCLFSFDLFILQYFKPFLNWKPLLVRLKKVINPLCTGNAAFHQRLHFLRILKRPPETEINHNLENSTNDP